MIGEQRRLVEMARQSLAAARVLSKAGFFDYAAGRAYYSMFYLASAVMLANGQRFKKHASLHAAFGQEIQRSGILGAELHRWLRDAADARRASDYFNDRPIGAEESAAHVEHAEEFLRRVTAYLDASSR